MVAHLLRLDADVGDADLAAGGGAVAGAPVAECEEDRCFLNGDAGPGGVGAVLHVSALSAGAARLSWWAIHHIQGHDGEFTLVVDLSQLCQESRLTGGRAAGCVLVVHPHRDVSVRASRDCVAVPVLRSPSGSKVRVHGIHATEADVGLHEVNLRKGVPVRPGLRDRVAVRLGLEEPECQVVQLATPTGRDSHIGVELLDLVKVETCLEGHVGAVLAGCPEHSVGAIYMVFALAPRRRTAVGQTNVDVVARRGHWEHVTSALGGLSVLGGELLLRLRFVLAAFRAASKILVVQWVGAAVSDEVKPRAAGMHIARCRSGFCETASGEIACRASQTFRSQSNGSSRGSSDSDFAERGHPCVR
mmetsp:Transcript_92479/g.193344  ORF Transcript_92479/g.193344 Transcript_92479/m.193344 type:complete len:360 (+) Transcript_92479:516-1595(+)